MDSEKEDIVVLQNLYKSFICTTFFPICCAEKYKVMQLNRKEKGMFAGLFSTLR